MIFINGQQIRGVATPDVLYNSVNQIAARNPQPAYDVTPQDAASKYIEDWKLQRPFTRFSAVIKFTAPSSSSAPHRPQFESSAIHCSNVSAETIG